MSETVVIIGLGYVGLPLAVAFSNRHRVIGYDLNADRVAQLRSGEDRTDEVSSDDLQKAQQSGQLFMTSSVAEITGADFYIVTVPTPIDEFRRPDLSPLVTASKTVGQVMRAGATVIYESTVYPGATEEVCVPILEAESGLRFNHDFHVGYSPERINPGDKEHRVQDIVKVTSGSTAVAADRIDRLYGSVITAGTHRAPSIRVAEAAKVIENTQRDVNIALMNELALLFARLGIDTSTVLEAAGTKWNFLPFRPGLVGGHCIGVDPYYLTHKAEAVGFHPQMILSGRRINDGMGQHVADQVVLGLAQRGKRLDQARVLVLGLTFKEDVPDLRNTKVVDVIARLTEYGIEVEVVDPLVDSSEAKALYGLEVHRELRDDGDYDGVVLAVAHRQFDSLESRLASMSQEGSLIFDVKSALPPDIVTWRL